MDIKKEGVALYHTVKEKLHEMIEEGKYLPGQQFPTESDLCEKFSVSRTTIRLALNQLKLEGHIYQVQGKGTFVSMPKLEQSVAPYRSFKDHLQGRGQQLESKVLEFTVISADKRLAKTLQIAEQDAVFRIERIRYADEIPLLFSITYIPWKITPGLTKEECSGSLYALIKDKFSIQLSHCMESMEPILIDEAISKHLNVPIGAPSFLLNTITYSNSHIPLEYSHEIIRGDRAKFTFERKL
ncbi:GntR family transcriptional regulator [Paenibacillus sp. HWE-109]|uniref:GntR family transcriptional regulator n=1 Tax=Paenibacillus sp. HWE-109 TaxID=1306526 RepID=UPI001EE11A73|nr:GntR family transcriptional regulator [Paenibacillus sp. HWE-109]UKS27075.1 GntR family transcriptional regulator [Paenibacillus sp. HWE-109]